MSGPARRAGSRWPEGPTTSRSREARKPVGRIDVSLNIGGKPAELAALHKAIGGSKTKTTLTKKFSTEDPVRALEELRAVSAAVKAAEKNPKGFK